MSVPVPPFTYHTYQYRRPLTPDYSISPPKKLLQLTFDDGPLDEVKSRGGSIAALENILDELKARGVVGAFFVLGQEVAQRPSAVQTILNAGHVVGNHSYTHINGKGGTERLLVDNKGRKRLLDEFERTHDLVARYVVMKHWRAPRLEGIQGLEDVIHRSPKMQHYLHHSDIHADSLDSQRTADKETVLNDLLSSKKEIGLYRPDLQRHKNVRLLFHVMNPTATALAYVLDGLVKVGHELVDFSQDS